MNIRKYKESDRSKLIELWKNVFPNERSHNEPSKVLEAKLAVDDLIIVAEEDGGLIGSCMAGYDGHRGWLYSVGVVEEFRRNGAGSKLVKYAIATLKEIGCIKVNLQIRSTNVEVASFYKSLGFAVEERLSMGVLIK
ncbi:GNAT family acetyltransferase [Saccharophagus degradans]|uniref:GNAT family acetyltransferase n=1 Tax=Saccharophagus degradans TaxID=86304 RepID=UPI001C08B72B|nr:GNAT family acetyltransferase [Saccharophagus degradans]MBU2984915.1 GNAT family acetyltransferase [Saccharophagus degradans]